MYPYHLYSYEWMIRRPIELQIAFQILDSVLHHTDRTHKETLMDSNTYPGQYGTVRIQALC